VLLTAVELQRLVTRDVAVLAAGMLKDLLHRRKRRHALGHLVGR
jgi:hypothetical protein